MPADDDEFFDVSVYLTGSTAKLRQRGANELTLTIAPSTTGQEIAGLIAEYIGAYVVVRHARTNVRVDELGSANELGLVSGDRLLVVGIDDTADPIYPSRSREGSLALRIVDGPSAGRHLSIHDTVTLGRVDVDGIHGLKGNTTSRRHAEITPSILGAQLHDLGSANGTWVNGRKIKSAVSLLAGDRISIGSNTAVVEIDGLPERDLDQPHLQNSRGRLLINRPARVFSPSPPESVTLSAPPNSPNPRRFPIGAAIAPLFLGIAMAVLWNPLFALFIALSPLMLGFSFLDDRRSGRRLYEEELATFQREVRGAGSEVLRQTESLAAYLRDRSPSTRQLRWWSHALAADIWSRRPSDDDFAVVALADRTTDDLVSVKHPTSGDPELIAEAIHELDQRQVEVEVPVNVDLLDNAVIGLCGDVPTSRSIARSIVAQLTVLRSPRDAGILLLAPEHKTHWSWTRWLPHATFADTGESVQREFGHIEDVVAERRRILESNVGSPSILPHILIIIDGALPISPRSLSRVLEIAPEVGVSVVVVGQHRYDLPGEVSVVAESARGAVNSAGSQTQVTFVRTGEHIPTARPRITSPRHALQIARDLAPLVDVTHGNTASEIPSSITLLEALQIDDSQTGHQLPSETAIAKRWELAASGLVARLGVDERAPVDLDLRRDGPHALVAGTTGSGKSEVLQTLVTSLALNHPPERLSFILVDYKGGAAFARCVDLPHTVGAVTNLDDGLADRALISLRAELRRRESILAAHDAKDLTTLERTNPTEAPPALVIVIDEFAALRSEVPEFVDGVIDIAQRGRSMGVHLVLATQKPGGVITPQIEANTNIRIALRMANEGESRDVLGSPDAATIDRHRPGRAFLRIGTDEPVQFQGAWVGGRLQQSETERCSYRTFGAAKTERQQSYASDEQTELDLVVDAIRRVESKRASVVQHSPWVPELSESITSKSLPTSDANTAESPTMLAVGIADHPELQRQDTFWLDLALHGNVSVYGAPGSGKTTLLRTVAGRIASSFKPLEAELHVIDGPNGGLRCLKDLPNVADVVDGGDVTRVQLLFAVLHRELERRQQAMTDNGYEDHQAWSKRSADTAPPVSILLIDGFDSLWASLESLDAGRVAAEISAHLAAGRAAGLHVVWTATQRSAFPNSVSSTAGLRLVQRLASADEYGWYGLRPRNASLPPGRTLLPTGEEIQVAVTTNEPGNTGAAAQITAIQTLTSGATDGGQSATPLPKWPEVVQRSSLPSPTLSELSVGLDVFGDPVTIDLARSTTALIIGPSRSGRSSILCSLVQSFAQLHCELELFAARPGSPVRQMMSTPAGMGEVGARLDALITRLETRRNQSLPMSTDGPIVIAIDDADDMLEGPEADLLTSIIRLAPSANAVVLAAATTFLASSSYSPWIRMMRSLGPALLIQPSSREETDAFGVPFPRRGLGSQPTGRGLLIDRQVVTPAQFSTFNPDEVSSETRRASPNQLCLSRQP